MLFLANGYRAYLQGLLLRELRGRLFDRYSHMRYRHYVSQSTGHFTNVINQQIRLMLQSFQQVPQQGVQVVVWRFGVMTIVHESPQRTVLMGRTRVGLTR